MMDIELEVADKLEKVVKMPGVTGYVFITEEGIPLAGFIQRDIDKLDFSVMCAAMVGSAKTIIQTLNSRDKRPDVITIESRVSKVIVYILDSSNLIVVAEPRVDIDLVIKLVKEKAEELNSLLKNKAKIKDM